MKYAVVLGASMGVGAAIAKQLSKDGYFIIGFHRGRHCFEADEVCNQLAESNYFIQDVGLDEGHVAAGVRAVKQCCGSVDVLVHSLAGASIGSVLALAPTQIERTMNMMAHSFLYWCRELFHSGLLAPSARLVALSNPCADFYLRNSGVIGAAKAALEAYVRMLAAELGPSGHFVNAVKFSAVVTPALQKVLSPAVLHQLSRLHDNIVPRGRIMIPEDVADIVSRLVQDTWTNGAILDHTGGSPMMLLDYAFNGAR